MGPNCPKHIVIVSETFADLDKELHMGGGGGPDCSPLLPQEYRRILFFFNFAKAFKSGMWRDLLNYFLDGCITKSLGKTLGLLGPNY
jgi:hypothetical protein